MKNKNLVITALLSISTLVILPGCDWIKNMRNKPHTCCSQDDSCNAEKAQEVAPEEIVIEEVAVIDETLPTEAPEVVAMNEANEAPELTEEK